MPQRAWVRRWRSSFGWQPAEIHDTCRHMRRATWSTLAAICVLGAPAASSAQVRWDAALQLGPSVRVFSESGARPGAAVMATAHVALLPLLSTGAAVTHDAVTSESSGLSGLRHTTSAGLRAKLALPWAQAPFRAWLSLGAGYGAVTAAPRTVSIDGVDTRVPRAGGGFVELFGGLGASYKFRKPWQLVMELGIRPAFAHHGSAYDLQRFGYSGTDGVQAMLTAGILLSP